MEQYLVAFVGDVRLGIVTAIGVVSGLAGAGYALMAMVAWYEAAQWRGDATPRQILWRLLVASMLLSFTSFLAATGGGQPGGGGFAVVKFQAGLAGEAAGAANAMLTAVFSLLAAVGWLSQLRGLVMAHDLGSQKSDASIWRVMGFIVGGAVLADLGTAIKALDATLGTGVLSG